MPTVRKTPTTTKPNRPPTTFEQRVYDTISKIPKGKIATYGSLAKALTSSPRAVGGALKRNPFAPQVPCHRVIAASLQIGGFTGSWGIESTSVQKKIAMLQEENVFFNDAGILQNKSCLLTATDMIRLVKSK